MNNLSISDKDDFTLSEPIIDWLVKILDQNYKNNTQTISNSSIDIKKLIFYDVIEILQYCKDETMKINKYHLKLKMKTKKYTDKKLKSLALLLCLYGSLPLIVNDSVVQVPVEIFIPNKCTYKIINPPVIVIDIENLLKENIENNLLKEWIKDVIKFNSHYIDISSWMKLPVSQRTLVSFIDISVKFLQQSMTAFEKISNQEDKEQVLETSEPKKTLKHNSGVNKPKLSEINILDNVELEQKLKKDLKKQKEEAINSLQMKLNNIHNEIVPKLDKIRIKKKNDLQESIIFYSNIFDSINNNQTSQDFVNEIESSKYFNQFKSLETIQKNEKSINQRNLHELIDIKNITYSTIFESWLLELESKSKSLDELSSLLREQFIKAKTLTLMAKSQNLIDIADTVQDGIHSSELDKELKILEQLAVKQFDIKYDISKYQKSLK